MAERKTYWYIQVGPVEDPRQRGKPVMLLANIAYKVDGSPKGIAVFDSQDEAQAFITTAGAVGGCSYPLTCVPMRTKQGFVRWLQLLRFCGGEKFDEQAVYINPTNPFGTDEFSAYPTLVRFIAMELDELVDWKNSIERLVHYGGHTLAVMTECEARKKGRGHRDMKWACQVMPGTFQTPSAFRARAEEITGTTEEAATFTTPWFNSVQQTIECARAMLAARAKEKI